MRRLADLKNKASSAKGCYKDSLTIVKQKGFSVPTGAMRIVLPPLPPPPSEGTWSDFLEPRREGMREGCDRG